MRIVECYEAVDGEIFTNAEDCKKHEAEINCFEHIKAIKEFCYNQNCASCPLRDEEDNSCSLSGNPQCWYI